MFLSPGQAARQPHSGPRAYRPERPPCWRPQRAQRLWPPEFSAGRESKIPSIIDCETDSLHHPSSSPKEWDQPPPDALLIGAIGRRSGEQPFFRQNAADVAGADEREDHDI